MPKSSTEARSGNRNKLQIAAINQSLSQWREPNGCSILAQRLLTSSSQNDKQRQLSGKKKKKRNSNVDACMNKLTYGHYTAAVRILSSDGLAPPTPDTLYDLQLKHSQAPPPAILAEDINAPALSVDVAQVLTAIKCFPKGISCGRDGLRAQHLLYALSGPAAAVGEEILTSIAGVINLWLDGKCPSILGEYIASAPLTPLLKPGGGIRPIVVGTIWRRLCSKLAATIVCKHLAPYFGTYQFGVGVPCGGEAIFHAENRLLEMKGDCNTNTMLLMEFQQCLQPCRQIHID